MLRSSEFNQDKTELIVTNNPFPLLISDQHLTTPFQYFPEDLSGRMSPESFRDQMPLYLPPLKRLPKELVGPEIRKLKSPTHLRFANKNDFKGEARFSKSYAERRLQRMYPHLRVPRQDQPKKQLLPSVHGWSPSKIQWEPLTLSCLTEMKPTHIVPGEDGFRYGRAPLWIVNNSVISNSPQ
ncbi:testis-specific gene 13 protein [Liasis olivaceus]